MRISWGYKIAVLYLSFVAGIMFLVFKANGEKYDLVTSNYYEEELRFQDVIEQKSRVAALSAPLEIVHTNAAITLRLPREFEGRKSSGELYLYRASDAGRDLRLPLATGGRETVIALPAGLQGYYNLKLSWVSEGRSYFHEQKMYFR